MAGYSGTPLAKKLGLKENFRVVFLNAPENFGSELGVLPAGVTVTTSARTQSDLILLFTKSAAELKKHFDKLTAKLTPAGMLWIAWPKKTSGVATDLNFDVVQRTGLDAGLVDNKICAVDDTWTGLRFVIRVKDRPKTAKGKQTGLTG